MSLPTDYNLNKYLAVTFKRGSTYIANPGSLCQTIPEVGLTYVGQVGQLRESHLYSITLARWTGSEVDPIRALEDVSSVEVQELRSRRRRGEEL